MKNLLLLTAITAFLILSFGCQERKPEKNCCEGYTGPITNHLADSLSHKDHFIIKDSIIAWTIRYQNNKSLFGTKYLPTVSDAFGDSTSFNRCIVKSIICNDSCIGLRVIYGMSTDLKVHVILVGIKPDYATLYIKRSDVCNYKKETVQVVKSSLSGSMAFGNTLGTGTDVGGAEYGMQP